MGPSLALTMLGPQEPVEAAALATQADWAGVGEAWVSEDYFYSGGIASAAGMLARTGLDVGLGIAPVAGRHPAILAMEAATLADTYPGRLRLGIGAGIPEQLDQIGRRPRSSLGAVRDTLTSLRTLLGGRELTISSELFEVSEVRLDRPPKEPPDLYVGAGGPKMLEVSAAHADGTILSVLSGPDYVRWARSRLEAAGIGAEHRLVVYALCSVDDDRERARDLLRRQVALFALPSPRNRLSELQGFADEAEDLAAMGIEAAIPRIPTEWLETLTVSGTPEDCVRAALSLKDAGADTVALCLAPEGDASEMLGVLLDRVAPELQGDEQGAG